MNEYHFVFVKKKKVVGASVNKLKRKLILV